MTKKITKSKDNKVIAGVCGGLGEYFDIDPVIVRLAFVLFVIMGGGGFLGYLIAALIIPEGEGADYTVENYTPNDSDVFVDSNTVDDDK